MVRHIVIWKFDEAYSAKEKQQFATIFKQRIEALIDVIDGIETLKVEINPLLEGSNTDLMLVGDYTDATALAAYATNPAHVEVANYLKVEAMQ